ncbi:MAG: hypothetical protein H0W97_01340 [Actinobacteria bacterium]|nr:hypothetical protein [Actinomycetota bacterium]
MAIGRDGDGIRQKRPPLASNHRVAVLLDALWPDVAVVRAVDEEPVVACSKVVVADPERPAMEERPRGSEDRAWRPLRFTGNETEESDAFLVRDFGALTARPVVRRQLALEVAHAVRFAEFDDAVDDPKLRRIAVDDRAVLTVFETVPPFRGVKVAGRVTRDSDPTVVREAREAIAPRYLGETRGAAFVESRGPGAVIRLPIESARAWDLEAALPPTDDQST